MEKNPNFSMLSQTFRPTEGEKKYYIEIMHKT